MCGIIGSTVCNKEQVQEALASFWYRGPDAMSLFSDEKVALGHLRLSIIDPDERSNQPFFNEARTFGIVFNGEIYNYRELREELTRTHGVRFRTASDTEVLLEGYVVWKENILPRLRGMFAFAIYDVHEQSIFLARDHAGIKPLYYHADEAGISFSSELKGVASLLRSARKLAVDRQALSLYPVFGYVPSPSTLIDGVRKLERGTWLRYQIPTGKSESALWIPRTKAVASKEELYGAIRRSILEHCISDVPVGTFFSGGVDSSLITAVLREAGMQLETFSVRVKGRSADEPYFREIARQLGVRASVAEFGVQEFEELYEHIFSKMDDPIAGPSLFPTAFVSRIAAGKVKVVLSGEGGDELFLGYPRTQLLAGLKKNSKPHPILDACFLLSPSFRGKQRLFSSIAGRLSSPQERYLLATSPARDWSPRSGWIAAQRILSEIDPLWIDRDLYLENMLMRKTDMATMYASIEGRVPLLGVELWNAAPQFSAGNLRMNGKALLKEMLAQYIPEALIERPKSGFGIPMREIFLSSPRLREDLAHAHGALRDLGIAYPDTHMLQERYPVYGFGLVALYHSLKNLSLI